MKLWSLVSSPIATHPDLMEPIMAPKLKVITAIWFEFGLILKDFY